LKKVAAMIAVIAPPPLLHCCFFHRVCFLSFTLHGNQSLPFVVAERQDEPTTLGHPLEDAQSKLSNEAEASKGLRRSQLSTSSLLSLLGNSQLCFVFT